MAQFSARKTTGPDGLPLYDLFRGNEFFGTVHRGHNNEWCFTDVNDERRGYRVRSLLTRRLGRNKEFRDMLPVIRAEYEGAGA